MPKTARNTDRAAGPCGLCEALVRIWSFRLGSLPAPVAEYGRQVCATLCLLKKWQRTLSFIELWKEALPIETKSLRPCFQAGIGKSLFTY